MDNYPAGVNNKTIDRHFGGAFNRWYEENEDWLLDAFLDHYEGVVMIPAVKDWLPEHQRLFDNFVEEEYDNAEQP